MKHIHKALAFVSLAVLAFALGCGHPRTLKSIEIQPAGGATVSGPGASLTMNSRQFFAFGNFINPTEQENITSEVTWLSDAPQIATVSNTLPTNGLVTSSGMGVCGTALITAIASKSLVGPGTSSVVVFQTAPFTVNDSTNPACGGTATTQNLDVLLNGTGTGTVTSNVGALTCSNGMCTGTFTNGTIVTLTAIPTGVSTFAGWQNCPLVNTDNTCTVTLNTGTAVGATFD